MKSSLESVRLPALGALSTALCLVVATGIRAQETRQPGVRRLTFAQEIEVGQKTRPKLEQALKLFHEGKPAEAIPIVKEVIALERQVLEVAASNPIEVECPPARNPLARMGLGGSELLGLPDDSVPEQRLPITLRDFEGACLGNQEILLQLHETVRDFPAATAVATEIAGITARLAGPESWQAAHARDEVRRLDRLAAFDRDRRQSIESARKATGLIATGDGPLGSAVCIDPEGIFLTVDQVATPPSAQTSTQFEYERSGPGGLVGTREQRSVRTVPMAILLDLGTPGFKQLPVRVLWKDKRTRLVLLKADPQEPLAAVELAAERKIAARDEAIALGLPFVRRIEHLAAGPTPTVRARPGRIAKVRERAGRPWFYELDSVPPPGYSGGPVFDENGHVIGIIVVGLPGADIHYVLPIDATTAAAAAIAVDFRPPPLPYSRRRDSVSWPVRVYSRKPLGADTTVDIRLGTGARARVFAALPKGDRRYLAQVVPAEPSDPDVVVLTLEARPQPMRQRSPTEKCVSAKPRSAFPSCAGSSKARARADHDRRAAARRHHKRPGRRRGQAR